ncbi:MAG: hypothetical protein GWN84_01920 [Gammaproteobacteria bacterium]|nr:hypothetical protein [Gammaproteobacteria bacterium]NIR81917.1 hypothetical protein [Gammaproteobacteria bacterium]NIR88749.1 hypothetical protein [Gammaproteobacteria bacterium]NIU03025.1 hypothetical protein [Gammaproteobacteria bacterium]NIV50546.1 hypothetical protein [Gammaproteobacteria bacterium]
MSVVRDSMRNRTGARSAVEAELVPPARHRAGEATDACAVVVLGAGRSGTSAITRGVQALGVDLGDRLRGGRGKNPTGFFEDRDLLAINKRLKRELGITGESVALIDAERWEAPGVRHLRQEATATIRRRFGRSALWGYKYARTLRLLPFWEAVFETLALDVRYVVALRNPLSVARSRARLDPSRGTQEKSDLEWLVNVVPYFRKVHEHPFVVVDYDAVMRNPAGQLDRIARVLRLPEHPRRTAGIRAYAETFLEGRLRHSRFTIQDLDRNPRVHPLVRDAYRWLHRLAYDEVDADSPELWGDWIRIEQGTFELAPLLRHIDRIQTDLRRAQRHPLGPLQALPRLWRSLRGR